MTSTHSPIGEDDLQAYVDGRLSTDRQIAVEAYLAEHAEVRARVATERQQRMALRDRLEAKFAEPIPARLRIASIKAAQHTTFPARMRMSAMAASLLLLGGVGGWLAKSLTASPAMPATFVVANDAVAAHRTFVVEVAHPVEVRAADEAHLVQWLSKRLGRSLKAPDLSGFGFRLMGGRLLPAGTAAAAQLMYDNDSETRLTVYLRAGEHGETAFRFGKDGDIATFTWLDQGLDFAVSAALDRDKLLPIAEAIYRDMSKAPAPGVRG